MDRQSKADWISIIPVIILVVVFCLYVLSMVLY